MDRPLEAHSKRIDVAARSLLEMRRRALTGHVLSGVLPSPLDLTARVLAIQAGTTVDRVLEREIELVCEQAHREAS